jgi:hypothetical protein
VSVLAEGVREVVLPGARRVRGEPEDGDWGEGRGCDGVVGGVHPPATTHVARVAEVMRWLDGVAADPATVLH